MAQKDNEIQMITVWGRQYERWVFCSYVLLSVYALIILATFLDYGLTTDEPPLLNYGRDIILWYQSGFTYQPIFETTNTWLYGGLVHVLGYVMGLVLPLSQYDAYHLCCAIIGFLGVVAAYRVGFLLGGGLGGFLAVLFLILTPRYYGHVFNNPKDIPFAVFYLWGVFCIVRGLGQLPHVSRDWIWKTGLAIGLTLGCRVAGLVLFAYLGLFWGLGYVLLVWRGLDLKQALRSYVLQLLAIVAVAYAVMLPVWPWALLNPLTGPFEAMGYFSQFLEPHFSFFDGQYVLNRDVPWFYVSKWLVLTLPEFVLLGLVFGAVSLFLCGVRRVADIQIRHLQHVVLIWSAVFPIVYAALMQTPFYDGYRHVLFVVPPLVVCSALGVTYMWRWLQVGQRAMGIVVVGLVIWTLVYMVRIHPNQSIYFNHVIAGGIQTSSERFETDYWGNSYKQGFDWIAEHYDWDFDKQKLKVASFFGQLHNVMDQDLFERIEVYENADLYLGTTRFDHHRLIPGEIVHTIQADGVPLLYIIRPDDRYRNDPFFSDSPFRRMYLGMRFFGADVEQKEAAFLKQVEAQNLAYFVAGAYNNSAMVEQAKEKYGEAAALYQKALTFDPSHLTTLYNFGQMLFEQHNYVSALEIYERMFQYPFERILDNRAVRNVYYVLGGCYVQLGRYDEAVEAYQKALERDPISSGIINNLASVYLEQEKFILAYDLLRPLVDAQADNVKARMNLAMVLVKQDSVNAALHMCQEVLTWEPDNLEAYVLMGQIYQAVGDVGQAQKYYQTALDLAPQNEVIQGLIQSLGN